MACDGWDWTVLRKTENRQLAGEVIEPIREMLLNDRRVHMSFSPDGIVAVLEEGSRERRWSALLKRGVDRGQFRQQNAGDRDRIENDMVHGEIKTMFIGLHSHHARPEQRHNMEWNRLLRVFASNPEILGFAFCWL